MTREARCQAESAKESPLAAAFMRHRVSYASKMPINSGPAAPSPHAKPIPCGFPRLFASYSPRITLIPTLSGLRISRHPKSIHKTRRQPSGFPALSQLAGLFPHAEPIIRLRPGRGIRDAAIFSKSNSCRKLLHSDAICFQYVTTQNKMESSFSCRKQSSGI